MYVQMDIYWSLHILSIWNNVPTIYYYVIILSVLIVIQICKQIKKHCMVGIIHDNQLILSQKYVKIKLYNAFKWK